VEPSLRPIKDLEPFEDIQSEKIVISSGRDVVVSSGNSKATIIQGLIQGNIGELKQTFRR